MSTDLHIAAGDDDLDEVKRLIKEGADVNQASVAGITPLHVAAGEVSPRFSGCILNLRGSIPCTERRDD